MLFGVESLEDASAAAAFDQDGAAAGAVGALSGRIVNVAGIDVFNSCFPGDFGGVYDRFRGGGRQIGQLVGGMEGAEMERDLRAQLGSDPLGQRGNLQRV